MRKYRVPGQQIKIMVIPLLGMCVVVQKGAHMHLCSGARACAHVRVRVRAHQRGARARARARACACACARARAHVRARACMQTFEHGHERMPVCSSTTRTRAHARLQEHKHDDVHARALTFVSARPWHARSTS